MIIFRFTTKWLTMLFVQHNTVQEQKKKLGDNETLKKKWIAQRLSYEKMQDDPQNSTAEIEERIEIHEKYLFTGKKKLTKLGGNIVIMITKKKST